MSPNNWVLIILIINVWIIHRSRFALCGSSHVAPPYLNTVAVKDAAVAKLRDLWLNFHHCQSLKGMDQTWDILLIMICCHLVDKWQKPERKGMTASSSSPCNSSQTWWCLYLYKSAVWEHAEGRNKKKNLFLHGHKINKGMFTVWFRRWMGVNPHTAWLSIRWKVSKQKSGHWCSYRITSFDHMASSVFTWNFAL